MNNFKQYKFNSHISSEILEAVEFFGKLGYTVQNNKFGILQAIEFCGICTWDDGKITEGYLLRDTHKDVTLEELKSMVCEASPPSFEASSPNVKTTVSGNYTLREQYKHLIGVQFNKNIYSFNKFEPRYVHDIIRDKDGDICVVDQYGIYYKLRDVEFYISDEHDGTATYNDYVLFTNT